jgi:polyisoprenoid-binding protein YceI
MTTTAAQDHQISTLPTPGTYAVDPVHSTISFVARHLMASKVRGTFTDFDGSIIVGETPERSSVAATVRADSVTTNQAQRDDHLRSADFLDATHHPELSLRSKSVKATGDGHFDLVTDLTIRGITREVTFDLEFLGEGPGMAPGTAVVGFEATATVDRRDFDVNFAGILENGSIAVGHKVTLELAVEASRAV